MNVKRFRYIGVTAILVLSVLAMFTAGAVAEEEYTFVDMWPELPQPWYFDYPGDVAVDSSGYVFVVDFGNNRIQKFAPGVPSDEIPDVEIPDVEIPDE